MLSATMVHAPLSGFGWAACDHDTPVAYVAMAVAAVTCDPCASMLARGAARLGGPADVRRAEESCARSAASMARAIMPARLA